MLARVDFYCAKTAFLFGLFTALNGQVVQELEGRHVLEDVIDIFFFKERNLKVQKMWHRKVQLLNSLRHVLDWIIAQVQRSNLGHATSDLKFISVVSEGDFDLI